MSALIRPDPFVTPHPALRDGFFRLTVADYHEMGATGILSTEDRVELLDGYLVRKPMQKSKHASTVRRIDQLLKGILKQDFLVSTQLPITLDESEPEPDFAIVRGELQTYEVRHPYAVDIALIIEISGTTLRLNREVKGSIYARAGIPEYWIINLVDSKVEVYTQPDASGYGSTREFGSTDSVPLVLNGKQFATISTAELLP